MTIAPLLPADFLDKLTALRGEIDAIDTTLIDLIGKRSEVVKRVGALKHDAGETTCVLRPDREAWQMKRIYDHFSGEAFPAAAAVHIWRHLINGSLAIESTLGIGVASPVTGAAELVWMAREYFGSYADITRESQPHVLVHKVKDHHLSIGVLPYPTSEDVNPWWLDLAGEGTQPKIFLKLPHLPGKLSNHSSQVEAYAIAHVSEAMQGEGGLTALVMQTETTCSLGKLQETFRQVGCDAQWISVVALHEHARAHFIEAKGAIGNADERLDKIRELLGTSLIKLAAAGHYAAPLVVREP